ncbi:hypothetical protein ACJX0J_009430, partial [Zea mays]
LDAHVNSTFYMQMHNIIKILVIVDIHAGTTDECLNNCCEISTKILYNNNITLLWVDHPTLNDILIQQYIILIISE